jgi:hypothetical protein
MSDYNCCIIVFNSSHQALSAEKALKEAMIRHAVINTPREFTVDCGISLRIEIDARDKALAALEEKGVTVTGAEPYCSRWI